MINPVIQLVTNRIKERSSKYRQIYLQQMTEESVTGVARSCQSCSGLAHAYAVANKKETGLLMAEKEPNIGIVSAATDMLSAHQPFYRFPQVIKEEALRYNMTAQIAGHTPAMCDGITQGQRGMHMSLFSRDIIAQSVVVNVSHNTYDGIIGLATCDKIKPGFGIGFSAFGHMPIIFAPGGPMHTGQSNAAKNAVRRQRAEGLVGKTEELKSEMKSYHGPGTCTFYGTANGNEIIFELMGLQLPGSSFIPPNDINGDPNPHREAMTKAAVKYMAEGKIPAWKEIMTPETIVNAIVGLHATGGSTNLILHLPAIAAANGIYITLDDIEDLSAVVPSIVKIYPNGSADINQFHAAGGMSVLIKNLLDAGMLHEDVKTVTGEGLSSYTKIPHFDDKGDVTWIENPDGSKDTTIITTKESAFAPDGGIKVIRGILGEGVSKKSSLADDKRIVTGPARVFETEMGLHEAFLAGELTEDFIAVVRGQGAWQNGMPELHKLITPLTVLQKKGLKVGLVTNGRLSGASGAVPTVIHLAKQKEDGTAYRGLEEPINKVQNGDIITINTVTGQLIIDITEEEWNTRQASNIDSSSNHYGLGRGLFDINRANVSAPQAGATHLMKPFPKH